MVFAATLAFFAWQRFYPVTAGDGWHYRAYRDDVVMVSALALDARGDLYVAQEHGRQRGTLVRWPAGGGAAQEVLGGLDKPDGLVSYRDGLVVSQEGGVYPLLWLHDGRQEKLFSGRHIEGVATDGQRIYAIEDLKTDGRLLRHDPASGRTEVLREGLDEAEGVAFCPDGRLFYSEKKPGWIKEYQAAAKADPIIRAGLNAPGFLLCTRDGLWIAEDATHRARLLLLDPTGTLQVVLAHLRSAQAVLPLAADRLLVAEQGRNRILEIQRAPR